MSKPKTTSTTKKTIVIKMRKAHRILVLTMFSLLFLFMLAAMIYVITSPKFETGIILMLFAIPTFLFLPFPVYYATWQITFDADGIQKRLSESMVRSARGHKSKKCALHGWFLNEAMVSALFSKTEKQFISAWIAKTLKLQKS